MRRREGGKEKKKKDRGKERPIERGLWEKEKGLSQWKRFLCTTFRTNSAYALMTLIYQVHMKSRPPWHRYHSEPYFSPHHSCHTVIGHRPAGGNLFICTQQPRRQTSPELESFQEAKAETWRTDHEVESQAINLAVYWRLMFYFVT